MDINDTNEINDTNDTNEINELENEIKQKAKPYLSEKPYLSDYGFILTRYVNSEKTNNYWNRCVKQLIRLYPLRKIVIIDDNSKKEYLKADGIYPNVIAVIQSEHHGRGELLPYFYFAIYKWFDYAVIIHDSVFFEKRIAFENYKFPVIPLWYFPNIHIHSHFHNNMKIANSLNYSNVIKHNIAKNKRVLGCFGVQSFIKYEFLIHIIKKYGLVRLLNVVKNREDRCSLERIFGVIFFLELKKYRTILGNIFDYNFGGTYEKYIQDKKRNKINKLVVKVFTGR